jgi:hypothetical protein
VRSFGFRPFLGFLSSVLRGAAVVAVNQAVVDSKQEGFDDNNPVQENQPKNLRAKKANNNGPGLNPRSRFYPVSRWTCLPSSMRGFRPPTPNFSTLSLLRTTLVSRSTTRATCFVGKLNAGIKSATQQ